MKIAFYKRFIELCTARSIKPTPALKDMGLSTGNLKKWQKPDAVVTVDTLEKIAEYFGVPPTYFFDENIRNTESVKARNTESVKARNTESVKARNTESVKAELAKLVLDEIKRCEGNLHCLKKIHKKLQTKVGMKQ